MRIRGEDGAVLPRDGASVGNLEVHGPWVASGYFRNEDNSAFTEDGWFVTGDIATLDADGFLRLTDRAKDVIKSGGEWISTVDLENAACSHPSVAMAPEELRTHVGGQVARWWTPDEVRIVDSLPISPTGKVLKRELREGLTLSDAVTPTPAS